MRKTIRKVTMVVPVLITSCHVSEKLKIGPVTAQTTMISAASRNAHGDPADVAMVAANLRNISFMTRSSLIFPLEAWRRDPASYPSRGVFIISDWTVDQ